MFNLFKKLRTETQPEKFSGIGTIFSSNIVNFSYILEDISPETLIEVLEEYLNQVQSKVLQYNGIVHRYEGSYLLAYWPPQIRKHAQMAFDASCEIIDMLPFLKLRKKQFPFEIDIVLSTGEMQGDYFGPKKQFQIVGKAMSIMERIITFRDDQETAIRFSQDTYVLIKTKRNIEDIGNIQRDDLEDIKIYRNRSANE